ncbi:MAG TPA: hypothetical protein VNL16_10780 [Chloroflexota bacterium]|nr:hypothetical protein [Chloroflexota bacterium]
MSRLLRKAGYDVVTRESSSGGADTAGSGHPSLVIVDVPDDRTGQWTNPEYSSPGRPSRPSVLWIGDTTEGTCCDEGHLAKPFTGSQLLTIVAALLSG